MAFPSQILKKKLSQLPHKSGVYIFKDSGGKIIYVGKSRDLKGRVKQYFARDKGTGEKTALLVSQITDIEIITTESEFDALLLEARLIRRFLPKYNVISRDDKSPLYIVLTLSEGLPRVLFARGTSLQLFTNRDRVFGPFQSSAVIRMLTRELRHIIPYCTQKQRTGKPCFYTHIGLCTHCPSVTARLPDSDKKKRLVRLYRTQVFALRDLLSGKSFVYLGLLEKEMRQFAQGQQFEKASEIKTKVGRLTQLLHYHYDPTLYVQGDSAIEDVFTAETERLRRRLTPYFPGLGPLKRIECVDISQLMGEYAVGSCVVLTQGRSDTSEYRRFRIKTVTGTNDVAMIAEVMSRRLHHPEWIYPDLFIIDGGKGQLKSALQVIRDSNLAIPTVGFAKRYEEIIISTGRGWKTLRIAHTDKAIHILQRIRDEAHRFAIRYHRKIRRSLVFNELPV